MRRLTTRFLLGSLILLGCGKPSQRDERALQQNVQPPSSTSVGGPSLISRSCVVDSERPVPISEDSIGPLPVSAMIGSFRESCPSARRTTYYGESEAYAALAFPFAGLDVMAVQWQDSLKSHLPADTWRVRGASGVLPGGVPMTATWGALRRAYGRGKVLGGEGDVTAMFCAHSRLFFSIRASPDNMEFTGSDADLLLIPDYATIREVWISREPDPAWKC